MPDVVVIGGGIIGMSVAYYAARAGMDVAVIERGEVAAGTSSRCDGNILAIDKEPGFDSQMSLVSQQLVAELSRVLDHPFEYRAPGSILICENDAEMMAAEEWVRRQQDVGLPFRMLSREDLRQEWPYLAPDLPGGLECATDSTVNPVLLTYSLAETARRIGASLWTHTEVKGIRLDANSRRVQGVETSRGFLAANVVVNAAGVWSKAIGAMVGVPIPIEPRKGHLLVSQRWQNIGLRKVMEFGYLMSKFGGERVVDEEMAQYGVALVYEPTASQNFLLGSSREFVGMDLSVNMKVVELIARRALRFFPVIRDIPMLRSYTGLRPWTPDHLPIVSEVESTPGFYIAAGHEGDGISLAAVTGQALSQHLSGTPTCIPLEPLAYHRFAAKEGEACAPID